ncbi:sensor histidine kinase [Nonomuraea sp. NPDC026600]|uniref:sensor histidine kinase n=1 Tax=Nonomuraea sp. NPDC026600 TaxID=3155363 RepID=UPI0033FE3F61
MKDRFWSAAERHPRAADAGLAAVVGLACLVTSGYDGWGWIIPLCLPLVLRRAAPPVIFWAVYALMMAAFLTGVSGLFPLIAALVALYTLVRYGTPTQSWFAAGAIELLLVTAAFQGELTTSDLAALTTALIATSLLAGYVRTRRAYLSELRERAHRLEGERDQQAALATAAERARIAREIHDIVAHNLAVMVALSDGAAYTATLNPARSAETMTHVAETGREALAEMRRVLALTHDGDLSPQPGLADLDRLFGQTRTAGIELTLTTEGTPGSWPPDAGLAVFRIVQEALTNTIKHGGPAVQVRLSYSDTHAEIEVIDNGPGAAPASDGHGLTGMRERAAAYGGQLQAGPHPGGGWRVHTLLHVEAG